MVAIGYTVSMREKLYDHQCEDLLELGFVLPEREPCVRIFGGGPRPPAPPIPTISTEGSTLVPATGSTAVPGSNSKRLSSSSDAAATF